MSTDTGENTQTFKQKGKEEEENDSPEAKKVPDHTDTLLSVKEALRKTNTGSKIIYYKQEGHSQGISGLPNSQNEIGN